MVRIHLPPAESRVRTRFGPQLRLFLRVRPQRIPLRYSRASIGLHCGKSCTRKSAGHCAGSSPLPVLAFSLTALKRQDPLVFVGTGGYSGFGESQGPLGTQGVRQLRGARAGDHQIHLPAAGAGAYGPGAPIEHRRCGAVPLGHLARVGLDLMLAILAPDDQPDADGGSATQRHRWAGLGFHTAGCRAP
jgi:hypothetical protein